MNNLKLAVTLCGLAMASNVWAYSGCDPYHDPNCVPVGEHQDSKELEEQDNPNVTQENANLNDNNGQTSDEEVR